MPTGKGQLSPAPSKRLNVPRTVEAATPRRRAISRVGRPAENFKRMISRACRIATLSAGIIAPLDCQRSDPKQASGGARRHSRPRAALFRSGGRHHLVMVGGIIPLRRAASSRYDGGVWQESAGETPFFDFTKLMSQFRLPGVDFAALVDRERKNIEALAKANRIAFEGWQRLVRRQAEMLQETMEKVVADASQEGAKKKRADL